MQAGLSTGTARGRRAAGGGEIDLQQVQAMCAALLPKLQAAQQLAAGACRDLASWLGRIGRRLERACGARCAEDVDDCAMDVARDARSAAEAATEVRWQAAAGGRGGGGGGSRAGCLLQARALARGTLSENGNK